MIRSNESTDLAGRAPSMLVTLDARDDSAATRSVFVGVLAVLLATGWTANHFAALMPVLTDSRHLSTATVDAMFGIYAVGLLPGLLIGGRVSDALGRQTVAWSGSTIALVGTVVMLLSQHPDALLAGRLIVGAGVGLAVSACTEWASDLKGPAGAATAGAVPTPGFAVGPFVAGAIASAGPPCVPVSFGIAAALLAGATVITVLAARHTRLTASTKARKADGSSSAQQSSARALSWAMPLAPWVFASATLGFITIPSRLHTGLAAALAAGTAALVVNGFSGLIQVVARARDWGPQSGTVAALAGGAGLRGDRRGAAEHDTGAGPAAIAGSGICGRAFFTRGLDRLGNRGATTCARRPHRSVSRGDLHRLWPAAAIDHRRVRHTVGDHSRRDGNAGIRNRNQSSSPTAPR